MPLVTDYVVSTKHLVRILIVFQILIRYLYFCVVKLFIEQISLVLESVFRKIIDYEKYSKIM